MNTASNPYESSNIVTAVRWRSRFFAFLSLISTGVACVIIFLWVRSYEVADRVTYRYSIEKIGDGRSHLTLVQGGLNIKIQQLHATTEPPGLEHKYVTASNEAESRLLIFASGGGSNDLSTWRWYSFPLWVCLPPLLLLPLCWIATKAYRRMHRFHA
jgi:hypothetical protein